MLRKLHAFWPARAQGDTHIHLNWQPTRTCLNYDLPLKGHIKPHLLPTGPFPTGHYIHQIARFSLTLLSPALPCLPLPCPAFPFPPCSAMLYPSLPYSVQALPFSILTWATSSSSSPPPLPSPPPPFISATRGPLSLPCWITHVI